MASSPAAVIVDQWELFRLGIQQVLGSVGISVFASYARAQDGLRAAHEAGVDLLIVGRLPDLKPERALRVAKALKNPLKVLVFLDRVEQQEIARLLSHGVDGLLMRTVTADELADAVKRIQDGGRVVSSALASGTAGMVGPTMGLDPQEASYRSGLSPKELEVLAVLAEGATYKEIAESLIVTQATVKTHLVHLYAKLGVHNRQEALGRALALGLLS